VRFTRYLEPFLGSGAVFFDLAAQGRLDGRSVELTDANRDLIDCYEVLRDQPDAVIAILREFAAQHAARGSEFYYDIRDRRFNPARAAGLQRTPELAAMLIYLNRTGFNGLYRLNRFGGFNVPAGRYAAPRICDEPHLRSVASTLARPGVSLAHGSFERALAGAGRGDFVYCDPPYAPLSATASFAHYTAGGFGEREQALLQRAIVGAARRGATVLVSNSSAPLIDRLYREPTAAAAGQRIHRVPARRAINSRASARGPVDELLITNSRRAALDVPAARMLRAGLPAARRRRA
jgi:DNA adenine methylase